MRITEYIQRCVSAIKQYGREHFRLTVLMRFIYCIFYFRLFLFSYKDPREHNVKVVVALLGILLLEGFILTVRIVLGESCRVVCM